uniref:Methyltransferase domain-containing protein n=1 Tax=Candidatus Kentrum sp. LPFa TaxID=2126335 RepID=A0A450WSI3_9GAMM|nr:MAG: Methyltransferase domain-containing protein [Candidatus Kentron sp. LPFa]
MDDPTITYVTSIADAAIDQLSDTVWKRRDESVWERHIGPLITPTTKVLDAGAGLGRLLRRLWAARQITLVEPDPLRFRQATATADCLLRGDLACLAQLEATDYHPSNTELLERTDCGPIASDKVTLLNTTMASPLLTEHGPFDLILSSHVFEHVTYEAIQDALAAFASLLADGGHLAILVTKAPLLYHMHADREFEHSHTLIERTEFADVVRRGPYAGLGVRYFPFDLFQEILADPYAERLAAVFGDEYRAAPSDYPHPAPPVFEVTAWEAYHSHYVGNIYPEHPQIQARLGWPMEPVRTAEQAIGLEQAVNEQPVLKRLHLCDMVVVAHRV